MMKSLTRRNFSDWRAYLMLFSHFIIFNRYYSTPDKKSKHNRDLILTHIPLPEFIPRFAE